VEFQSIKIRTKINKPLIFQSNSKDQRFWELTLLMHLLKIIYFNSKTTFFPVSKLKKKLWLILIRILGPTVYKFSVIWDLKRLNFQFNRLTMDNLQILMKMKIYKMKKDCLLFLLKHSNNFKIFFNYNKVKLKRLN
jgi:hypothetical protein